MKFIHYLETIKGISIYPLISLVLFVLFFSIVSIWVFRVDNGFIEHMKNIPLENDKNK